jgi:hypothetical protein
VGVNNEGGTNGGDEILQDDNSDKIELPFGIGKVSKTAAYAFIGIIALIIVLIIVGIVIRRRNMYKRLLEERRVDQGKG